MPVSNVARGKIGYYATLPAANDAIVAVLWQATAQVSDDLAADYVTLAAWKAAQTEATFTNYARKPLVNVTLAVDNTNNRATADADDLSWTAAGGTTNNTLGRIGFFYVPDTTAQSDATAIPLTFYPYATTTDGTTRTVQINALGFWRST